MVALLVSSSVAALLYLACWIAMRLGRISLRLAAGIGGFILTAPILIYQLSQRRGIADLICMGVPAFALSVAWTLLIGQIVQQMRNGESGTKEET